jgi:hypothetical protein
MTWSKSRRAYSSTKTQQSTRSPPHFESAFAAISSSVSGTRTSPAYNPIAANAMSPREKYSLVLGSSTMHTPVSYHYMHRETVHT